MDYAVMPLHGDGPAPTLLLLGMAGADALATEPYCRVGRLMHAQGSNVVSLDLPCHGADRRPGEKRVPTELADWARRIATGEDIVAAFQARMKDVVEHLISTGSADPARIAAAGISHGGFMALHAGAVDQRIRAIIAFSPVTDLLALSEFAGLEQTPLASRLARANATEPLADRAIWISIGKADTRVDTRKAVASAEAVREAAAVRGLPPRVTLRLLDTPGHAGVPESYDEAATWLMVNN